MATTEKHIIFTIVHSNLDLETFITLLKNNGIEVLVDVLFFRSHMSEGHLYSRIAESTLFTEGIERLIKGHYPRYVIFVHKMVALCPKEEGIQPLSPFGGKNEIFII